MRLRKTGVWLSTGALLLAVAACGTAQPDPVAPSATTRTIPPQPTPHVGKYADPDAMVAKVQAAGVTLEPFPGGSSAKTGPDLNGAHYWYGQLGTETVGLFTFDYVKVADDTETQKRSNNMMTYRGDGWIVATKTEPTLTKLTDILNK